MTTGHKQILLANPYNKLTSFVNNKKDRAIDKDYCKSVMIQTAKMITLLSHFVPLHSVQSAVQFHYSTPPESIFTTDDSILMALLKSMNRT